MNEVNVNPQNALNGEIVVIAKLPGYHHTYRSNYLIRFPNGREICASPDYLRPAPPPKYRGDIDEKSSWDEWEKATGIPADVVRGTDSFHG
jgi:hypothetical protein